MSQSAGAAQWEMGNKLACQLGGFSLVTPRQCRLLIGQSGPGVRISRKSDPCASRSQTLLDNLQLNFYTQTFPKRHDTK